MGYRLSMVKKMELQSTEVIIDKVVKMDTKVGGKGWCKRIQNYL